MNTEMEEQLKRLSEYVELMGLNTGAESHFASLQNYEWENNEETLKFQKWLLLEIKAHSNKKSIPTSKWNIDPTFIKDLSLLIIIIKDIWNQLVQFKDEIAELEELQLEANNIAYITFVCNVRNAYPVKIKEKENVKLIVESSVSGILEEKKKVYENLLSEIEEDGRSADHADKFRYKATYILSKFLKNNIDHLYDAAIPRLLSSFYLEVGILQETVEKRDRKGKVVSTKKLDSDSLRKKADLWITYGSKLVKSGK
jgi:hypothetical protein